MSERGAGSGGRTGLLRGLTDALRWLLRPAGYLAFVVALWALSAAAALLGDEHELGFFARRLNGLIWRATPR